MNNIDSLLIKYFNGTSTTEEEKRIKKYFNEKNILSEHEIYRPLFSQFKKEKEIKGPVINLTENKRIVTFKRRITYSIVGTVAVILIAITLNTFIKSHSDTTEYIVIVNGKAINDRNAAQQYADNMFCEAEKMVESLYEPFRDAVVVKNALNAERISIETTEKIEYIKSNYNQ